MKSWDKTKFLVFPIGFKLTKLKKSARQANVKSESSWGGHFIPSVLKISSDVENFLPNFLLVSILFMHDIYFNA